MHMWYTPGAFHMTSSIRLQRFSQFLLKETTPNLLSSPQLLLNFHSHYPSTSFYSTSRILHNQDPKNTAVQWNLTIRDASATNPLRALSLFQKMLENTVESTPIYIDPFIYASLIKACNKAQAFLEGKSVHGHIIRLGLDCNVNISNSLVCFYLGSVNFLSYAAVLFDSVVEKSVVAVNCMISGQVRRGNLDLGLSLFVKILDLDKKIRYVNRKKLAERRPRVRGQFVRKVNGVNVDLNRQPPSTEDDQEEEEESDEEDQTASVGLSPVDVTSVCP